MANNYTAQRADIFAVDTEAVLDEPGRTDVTVSVAVADDHIAQVTNRTKLRSRTLGRSDRCIESLPESFDPSDLRFEPDTAEREFRRAECDFGRAEWEFRRAECEFRHAEWEFRRRANPPKDLIPKQEGGYASLRRSAE